jgi:hypothetical protein
MDLDQIKESVNQGLIVYWGHSGYKVMVDSLGQYFIKYSFNGRAIPLIDSQFSEDFKTTDFFLGN